MSRLAEWLRGKPSTPAPSKTDRIAEQVKQSAAAHEQATSRARMAISELLQINDQLRKSHR